MKLSPVARGARLELTPVRKLDEQQRKFCPLLRFGPQRTCAQGAGRTVSPDYQQRFCLTAGFSQCPLYTGPRLAAPGAEEPAPSTLAGPCRRRYARPLVAGYAISAALALGAVAGTLWQLTNGAEHPASTPAISATAPAQPGALAASATPLPAATLAPPTVTPVPASAAPRPSATAAVPLAAPAASSPAPEPPATPESTPPPVATGAPATAAPQATVYTVQPGDTLHAIASRFHTTVDALVQRNQIADPDVIRPGTVLQIPPSG